MELSNAMLTRKHIEKLERDKAWLLATLRDVADYCGGSDLPKSHPLGAAHACLRDFELREKAAPTRKHQPQIATSTPGGLNNGNSGNSSH